LGKDYLKDNNEWDYDFEKEVWVFARNMYDWTNILYEADYGEVQGEKNKVVCGVYRLEKVYERVPREILWLMLEMKGLSRVYVKAKQDLYKGALTKVNSVWGNS